TANESVCRYLRTKLGAQNNAEALAKAQSCAATVEGGSGSGVLGRSGESAAREGEERIMALQQEVAGRASRPRNSMWAVQYSMARASETPGVNTGWSPEGLAWGLRTTAEMCNQIPFPPIAA